MKIERIEGEWEFANVCTLQLAIKSAANQNRNQETGER